MNLVEILKNVPRGTKLYSSICGVVTFDSINNSEHPIVCTTNTDTYCFTKNGKYDWTGGGECVLFPSKENRDWSTFKVEPKFEFKTFDKVLVRDDFDSEWFPDLFAYSIDMIHGTRYYTIGGIVWEQCIPYEGNEHLCGTTTDIDV